MAPMMMLRCTFFSFPEVVENTRCAEERNRIDILCERERVALIDATQLKKSSSGRLAGDDQVQLSQFSRVKWCTEYVISSQRKLKKGS